MCLVIVDLNVAVRVLLTPDDAEYKGLHKAFFGTARPNSILVYGGHLAEEYRANLSLRRVLVQLDRAARARAVPDADVHVAAARIAESGFAASNDHHILALAQVSGARVLCSADKDLRGDFKDSRLIHSPRGKIYSRKGHAKVLSHNC